MLWPSLGSHPGGKNLDFLLFFKLLHGCSGPWGTHPDDFWGSWAHSYYVFDDDAEGGAAAVVVVNTVIYSSFNGLIMMKPFLPMQTINATKSREVVLETIVFASVLRLYSVVPRFPRMRRAFYRLGHE